MPTRRFEVDVAGTLAIGRLRLAAATVVLIATLGIVATGPGLVGWVCVVGGWAAAVAWIRSWRASRHRALVADQHLLLGDEGLALRLEGREEFVAWTEVEGAEVDEDRLVVRVLRRNSPALVIEPMFRGVGVHELADAIVGHRSECTEPHG